MFIKFIYYKINITKPDKINLIWKKMLRLLQIIKFFSVLLILFLKKTKTKIENWANNGSRKVFSWLELLQRQV